MKQVKKIFVREKDSIVRLAINGEAIETTDEHPFYVEGIGFVGAGDLEYGDEVRLQNGDTAKVDSVEFIELDEPVKVYNFEVEDFHTYYVGEHQVLVHNTCKAEDTTLYLNSPGVATVKESDFIKWLNGGEKNNTVYFGMEGQYATYVGITKQNLLKRLKQHNSISNKNQKNFTTLDMKYTNLTRNQARAIEQYYIEMAMGPNMRNKISSISPNNRFHDQAINWAKEYLESQ